MNKSWFYVKIVIMTKEERILKEDWEIEYGLMRGEIIWLLKNSPNIALRSLCNELEDIIRIKRNGDYRPEFLRFNDQELASYYINDDIIDIYLSSKPKDITQIEIPKEALVNYEWLSRFPNLNTIITDEMSLDSEAYNYIKNNTNIKRIVANRILGALEKRDNLVEGQVLVESNNKALDFLDKAIRINSPTSNTGKLNIYANSLYEDLSCIMDLLKEYSYCDEFIIEDQNRTVLKYDKQSRLLGYIDIINPSYLKTVVSELEKHGNEIKLVELFINNKTYRDFYALKSLSEDYNFAIYYDNCPSMDYDNYLTMRDLIDYYSGLINARDLSALEKIMYLYDMMKSSKDNESGIPGIQKTELFTMLLNEWGIISKTITNNQHIITIEDEKYNINGDYVFDYLKEVDDYEYFMVPFRDYGLIFQTDVLPVELQNSDNEYHKRLYLERQNELERLDIESFKRLLINVRLAEGYTKDEIQSDIENMSLCTNERQYLMRKLNNKE